MIKNNSGFSMMELLAAIVVLGILMGTAVPIVISVLNDQKNKTYVDDALRLASSADYKIRSDNDIQIPKRGGGCILINLAYMDNNSFEKAPYGGEYDVAGSFVLAYRNPSSMTEEYTYYVRLVEKTKSGGYRGVNLVKADNLYKKEAKDLYVESMGASTIFDLADYEESGMNNTVKQNLRAEIEALNDEFDCSKDIWTYAGYEFE